MDHVIKDGITPDQVLDTSGLRCPMPILMTQKQLAKMTGGQILHVIATDKGSLIDFPVFTQKTGHELLSQTQHEGVYGFLLRRKIK